METIFFAIISGFLTLIIGGLMHLNTRLNSLNVEIVKIRTELETRKMLARENHDS